MVPAIEKADMIFSFLMQHPEGATLKETSTVLGIPKSTTHRLLISLSNLDYIEHDSHSRHSHSGRFFLGPKLMSLSRAAERRLNLNRITTPYLEELSSLTRETVKLSIIRHLKVYVINTVLSPRIMKITVESGTIFPPHIGAAAKLLLSSLSDEEIEGYLEQDLEEYTVNSVTDKQMLKKEIAAIREEGVARDRQEETIGISGIAAPVRDSFGGIVAAVSIPYLSALRTEAELLPSLLECVNGVSRRLGYYKDDEHSSSTPPTKE
ncbi:IclR family transcriptional regulator [Marispirochaeta sp.]|jgi:IclR family transcriptional regulator, KDG regulon repressor|uniref:IclR family transcriptional regulator n=1 Tax=Marispirochaeta sp. TaxID=2038653 RepID=UPI0029C6F579|nr:IclR family transcriptional regulator [Marispirochaeta sp.]